MYEMNYKFDFRGDCTDKDLIWYIGSTLFFYDYVSTYLTTIKCTTIQIVMLTGSL